MGTNEENKRNTPSVFLGAGDLRKEGKGGQTLGGMFNLAFGQKKQKKRNVNGDRATTVHQNDLGEIEEGEPPWCRET